MNPQGALQPAFVGLAGHGKQRPETLQQKYSQYLYRAVCLFHWASEEFQIPNPMKSLPAHKFTSPEVESFTKEEIDALLKACDFCDEAGTDRRKKFTMNRATARRDRAIILTTIDSGLRASELCSLHVADLDQKTGKITIRYGVNGGAKGGKARFGYLGKTARKAVWRYLADREDGENAEAQLFLGKNRLPFSWGLPVQHNFSSGTRSAFYSQFCT